MSLPAITFTEALMLEGLILMLIFYLMFRLSKKGFFSGVSFNVSKLMHSPIRLFSRGYVVLVASFLLVTLYAMYQGSRPTIYFLLLSLFAVYIIVGNGEQTSKRGKIFTVCLVSLLLPITINVNNNSTPFWGDANSILERSHDIIQTGTLQQYKGASYYYPFPVLALLLASITAVSGFALNAYAFLVPVCSLLFISTLYLTSKEMSRGERTALLVPLLVFSIPSLDFIALLPRYFSIISAFLCLLLVVKSIQENSRRFILCLIPLLVITVVSHPSGPVFILSLIAPMGIHSMMKRESSMLPHQFRSISILVLLVMFFYWIFAHGVLFMIAGPTRDILATITNYMGGSQQPAALAERPYLQEAAQLTHVAFAWAIPVAIIAWYLLHRLHDAFSNQETEEYVHWSHEMAGLGASVGLALLLISFLTAQYGHHTYLILPTYAVLLFLMIIILPRLLSSKNKIVIMTTTVILATSLFIGSSSPNWAPLENPDFPQKRHLFTQYRSTSRFAQDLPRNTSLTAIMDFDVTLKIPQNVEIVAYSSSYRVVRRKLTELERGTTIDELSDEDSMIFIVRLERLKLHGEDVFNLVQTSGKHVLVTANSYNASSP